MKEQMRTMLPDRVLPAFVLPALQDRGRKKP
jgi:hypothetical protein